MAATTGVVTIDVGAFPGIDTFTTTVAASGCQGSSQVEAWIIPYDTADHTLDEHLVDPPQVMAHSPNNGVGFSVTLLATGQFRVYGTWRVGWVHS